MKTQKKLVACRWIFGNQLTGFVPSIANELTVCYLYSPGGDKKNCFVRTNVVE
jgi:hypothetical protein